MALLQVAVNQGAHQEVVPPVEGPVVLLEEAITEAITEAATTMAVVGTITEEVQDFTLAGTSGFHSLAIPGDIIHMAIQCITHTLIPITILTGTRIPPRIRITLTHMTSLPFMLNLSNLIPGITARMHRLITLTLKVALEGGQR